MGYQSCNPPVTIQQPHGADGSWKKKTREERGERRKQSAEGGREREKVERERRGKTMSRQ